MYIQGIQRERKEFNCNAPHLQHHNGLARYVFSLSEALKGKYKELDCNAPHLEHLNGLAMYVFSLS